MLAKLSNAKLKTAPGKGLRGYSVARMNRIGSFSVSNYFNDNLVKAIFKVSKKVEILANEVCYIFML